MTCWEKNWNALLHRYPDIRRFKPESIPEIQSEDLIQTAENSLTFRWGGQYLHSPRAPKKEAQKLLKIYSGPYQGILFFGLGLGYYIEAVMEQNPNTPFLLLEPDPRLFFKLLTIKDFSHLFANPGFNLILAGPPESIHFFLETLAGKNFPLIALPALKKQYAAYFRQTSEELNAYLNRKEININTLRRFGKLWTHNFALNLPLISKSPGIQRLQGLAKDLPVVLIAAGPSLEALLPYKEEIRERALVIAVDTAASALKRVEWEPDILMSGDPQYWNSRHLDRICFYDTILVTDGACFPSILKNWKGKTALTASHFPLCEYLEAKAAPKGKIKSGGSVITSAWDLARVLESKEIYFLGMDLGYPNLETHIRGSFFEERSHRISNRFSTSEGMHFHYLRGGYPKYAYDNQNNPILTDQRMSIYATWFERILTRFPEVNSHTLCEKSLKIPGIELRKLEDFLAWPPCREVINERKSNINWSTDEETEHKLFQEVNAIIESISTLLDASKQGKNLARQLLQGESSETIQQQLADIDHIIRSQESSQAAGFLVEPLMEDLIDRTVNTWQESVEASIDLYDGLSEALEYTLDQLKMAEGRLQ